MPHCVVDMVVKALITCDKLIKNSKVLLMGLAYKENVPDIRESPSLEIIDCLKEYSIDVYAHDPYLSDEEILELGLTPFKNQEIDCTILAVKHKEYQNKTVKDIMQIMPIKPILIDLKGVYKNNKRIKKSCYYRKF
jgi:UDPglucose 6-dehydrogenase/UDP-N-acetyl-D-galactosamine dehydrogenase